MNRSPYGSAFLASLFALLASVGVQAQLPDLRPLSYPKRLAHKPTPIPDRVLLTWQGDPARTQAVTWRTDSSVKRAIAQIAPSEAGPKFVFKARTVSAATTPLKTDLGKAHYHSVNFDGLTPRTQYVYRVGDGGNWSEWFQFTTASDKPEPFSFIYFGDAQNVLKPFWSRVIREAYSDMPKARFLLHAGDLINRANRDDEWGEWFYAGGWINGMVPSVPTPGNHEYEKVTNKEGKEARVLSRHWRPQFALPENGPSGLEETVYYLDYQGVRIVSLNSNEDQKRQVAWLEKVLSDNPNQWTILTFHHPIYSTARGRDNKELRELWQPVFDKHKVDLVLQGHDHTYGRSGLMTAQNVPTGATARAGKSGTVYVVSVSGPKMYRVESAPWMKKSAADTQLYQIIAVNGGRLHYEAHTVTGEPFDVFELRKTKAGVNELIEREQLESEAKKAARLDGTHLLGAFAALACGLLPLGLRKLRGILRRR